MKEIVLSWFVAAAVVNLATLAVVIFEMAKESVQICTRRNNNG